MTLDDLARAAGAEVRRAADEGAMTDPVRYRRRRQNRLNVLAVSGAVVGLVAVLALITVAPPSEKSAAAVTTTGPIPPFTTSTVGVTTPTTVRVVDMGAADTVGAGWELIEARSVAGREGAAVVWTEEGLVVWGGVGPASGSTVLDPFLYRGGSIRDSATGIWRSIAPVDVDGLCGGPVRALSVGDRVLFYGALASTDDCALAAIYHPAAETWFPVDDEFAAMITRDTVLVWTGELVVAPELGIAYYLHSGNVIEIPALAPRLDSVVSSPLRAHWTGSEVLAVGSGPAFAWTPGDDEWREVSAPTLARNGRTSVWADRLWVVNSDMAANFLADNGWHSERIPLTFECVPEAVAVSGTPVIRTCSGLAIWDDSRATFVLAPLEVPGWGVQSDGVLVAAEDEDAVYSVGSRIYRFQLHRLPGGRVGSPQAIPIGEMELQMVEPWEFDRSYAFESSVAVVLTGPSQCTLISTGGAWDPEPEFEAFGTMTIHNPGRAVFDATMYRSVDAAARFGLAIQTEAGTVFVRCDGGIDVDPALISEHAFTLASRLWWPNRPLVAPVPTYTTGPGWESLDAGPIAGRMRLAAAWIGEELFVWGGHDGYIQEAPGPEVFHQDAYLFDPVTQSWRQAAAPPLAWCRIGEAEIIPMGEAVLIRGLHGCSAALLYFPATDSWERASDPMAEVLEQVGFAGQLVWTGDSLAAPTRGVTYFPDTGEIGAIPPLPAGEGHVTTPVTSHWTGDRIVAIGTGDVYTLAPGDDEWVAISGPPLPGIARVAVWYGGGLAVTGVGHVTAFLDAQGNWRVSAIPLYDSGCRVELAVAAGRPVAVSCTGIAIWDPVRDSWLPIPLSTYGGSWTPLVVGSDDAIYSLGEGFHRYPIEFIDGGAAPAALADPVSIPVGVALLDTYGFHVLNTIGWSQVRYADNSIGFSILVNLIGSQGDCEVIATLGGPPLGQPDRVIDTWGYEVLVLPSERSTLTPSGVSKPMTHLAVPTGDAYAVHIHCESEEDALALARNLTIP